MYKFSMAVCSYMCICACVCVAIDRGLTLVQDITAVMAEKDSQIKSLEEKLRGLKAWQPLLH